MYILDALIIIAFIVCIMGGIRRGFLKSVVLLAGLVISVILSFWLKNPISAFMYKAFPFFSFNGVELYNILLYEVIAFLIIFSVIYLILRILLKITGLIEKVFDLTIILGIISKILGALVGFIEGYILVFISLFILTQPIFNISGFSESILSDKIINNTPILTSSVSNVLNALNEMDNLDNNDKIKLFIDYDIISEENLNILIEKGKIKYDK